ncbi:uncharacterized protein DS421_9g264170 [Arachis hypogaea]|nr:uncharacterized protein DS421_9g264170 [Arachis hypogaea]
MPSLASFVILLFRYRNIQTRVKGLVSLWRILHIYIPPILRIKSFSITSLIFSSMVIPEEDKRDSLYNIIGR